MLGVSISQQDIEVFFLVLVRVAAFINIAPVFNDSSIPVRYKLGFSLALSYVLYLGLPADSLNYDTTLGYALLIIKEAAAGLLVGLSANLSMTIVLFAGRIIDMDIGLSMASLYDPTTKDQVTLTGGLYQRLFIVLFILSDMHLYLIGALADTYELVPIGEIGINLRLYNTFVGFLSDYFVIGFRIILPVFAVTLIINCAMGIMTKVAPQIHMFSVGAQIKILFGFIVMFMTIAIMPNLADYLFDEMKIMVVGIIQGMSGGNGL